jgi:hypothetical protein
MPWFLTVRCLVFLDEVDEAQSQCEELLRGSPHSVQSQLHLARLLHRRGEKAGAREAIQKVRRSTPNLRGSHVAGLPLMPQDDPATQRYIDAVCRAGLPE